MILQTLLEKIATATNLPIVPFDTQVIQKCMVYQYSTISDNGVIAQTKLQIRIFAETLADALSIESAIKSAIIDMGDVQKAHIEGVTSIVVNGGGTLKDYTNNTIQDIIYFIITKKSEVE